MSLKVLFIVPPSNIEEHYGSFVEAGAVYPSLGIAYLGAGALKEGHEVKVIDSEVLNLTFKDLEEEIRKFNPDVIGMQTFCANINRCYKVAEIAKRINSEIKIVLGGVQVTQLPYESIKNENVDFIIYGEADISFLNLLKAIERNKKDFSDVKGLIWKKNGKVITNPPQELIKNLDILPYPALELFPIHLYRSSSQVRGNKTLHMFTSRGCPYDCSYCAGDLIFGKSFRFHSSKRVIDEINHLKRKFNIDSIQFYDETFTINRKRVIDLCEKMIEKKVNISWSCFTRVDLVDEELLRLMKRAGCYQIFFGVETGVERLLKLIRKRTTLQQAREAFKLTRKLGIETVASFMLTLPTETEEETWQSIKFGLELDPDYVYWLTFTPYPGTELAEYAEKTGKILHKNYELYNVFSEIVYVPDGRDPEEIRRTIAKAYRMFYLRPKYIIRRINSLRHLPPKKIWSLFKSGVKTLMRKKV